MIFEDINCFFFLIENFDCGFCVLIISKLLFLCIVLFIDLFGNVNGFCCVIVFNVVFLNLEFFVDGEVFELVWIGMIVLFFINLIEWLDEGLEDCFNMDDLEYGWYFLIGIFFEFVVENER